MEELCKNIELLTGMIQAINTLSLSGVKDWETGMKIAIGMKTVKNSLEIMKTNMEVAEHEKNHS